MARRKATTVSFWRSASTARTRRLPLRVSRSPARRIRGARACAPSRRGRAPPASPKRSSPCALDPAVEDAVDRLLRDTELAGRVRDGRVNQHAQGPWLVCLRVGATRFVPLARCIVVGLPAQYGHRYRLGRNSTNTGPSNKGRWRRQTTASNPCSSRISRPQWRHRVPSKGLSTRMSQCPCSVLCVETMRTSGKFSGT